MKGLRATPPALLVAYALAIASMIARAVFYAAADEPWGAYRFELTMRGLSFAYELVALIGMAELGRRVTGRTSIGCTIAVIGFAFGLATDLSWTLAMFKSRIWEHEWIYDVNNWAWWTASTVALAGIVVAAWDRLAIAIATLVIGMLVFPPPLIDKHLYSWLPDGKLGIGIGDGLSVVRLVMLVIAIASFSRGAPPIDRRVASAGLRGCASALWLRIIAAVCVVLLTLMGVAGARRGGGEDVLKLATMSGAIINIAALTWFGVSALRTASAGIAELNRYALVIAGAASVWSAGVVVGQLPHLYHMLYKPDSTFGGGTEYAQALAVAMPIVTTGSVALVALVIGAFAAHRNAEDLRVQAQGRGIAFILLLLVSIAIQTWILPDARSVSSFAMASLIAAGAGLAGTILIARLCVLATEELEKEPGLPAATVVSGGT